MASKISKEVSIIASGAGQKYGHVIQGWSAVASSIIFCFIYGWLMTLILIAAFPFMIVLMVVQNKI